MSLQQAVQLASVNSGLSLSEPPFLFKRGEDFRANGSTVNDKSVGSWVAACCLLLTKEFRE